MDLKGFHLIFISASCLLSLFFGFWAFQQFAQKSQTGYIVTSIISIFIGIGLIVYGFKTFKKVIA